MKYYDDDDDENYDDEPYDDEEEDVDEASEGEEQAQPQYDQQQNGNGLAKDLAKKGARKVKDKAQNSIENRIKKSMQKKMQQSENPTNRVGNATQNATNEFGNMASQAGSQVAQTTAQTAQQAGKVAAQTGRQAAQTTAKAAQTTAQTTAKVAQATAKAAQVAAKTAATAGKALVTAGKAIASAIAAIGPVGWIIIGIILGVIILGVLAWGILNSAFDGISDLADSLSDTFTATSSQSQQIMGTGINITDETIEKFVEEIESMGLSLKDLYICGDIDYEKDADDPENIKQRNKYLRKFLLASLVTQYPDFGIQEDETHYNGIIKVRRASNTDTLEQARDMEYVTLDVLEAMVDAVNSGVISDTINASYPTTSVEVRIDSTRNGMPIPAIIYLPEGAENVPMVLMCHGFTGKKEGDNDHFLTLGNMLAQNGIAAITIDFAACGDSGDLSVNYTLSEMQADMDAAIQFMKDTYSIDETKIGIVGHSMGGRVASEYLDNVQAAALWAPADGDGLSGLEFLNDYNGLYDTARAEGSVDSGWDCNGEDFILSRQFFWEMEDSHPLEKLSSYTNPLLVAFGDHDEVITEARDSIQAAMPAQGIFKTYDQDHNFTMENDDEHQLLVDTANLFTQAFFGHDISDGGEEVANPISGQTIEQVRNRLQDVFSVDNEGNLYFASMSSVETTTLDENGNEVTTTTYTAKLMTVNYRNTVEKYAFPIEVSVALCFITQNPEYVSQFIDEHVLSGEIELTILDTESVDTHESWYDYTIRETTTVTSSDGDYSSSYKDLTTNRYNYQKTITTNVSSIAAMTDVDTWMAKSSVNYTNTPNQVEHPLGEETVVKNVECPVDFVATETSESSETETNNSTNEEVTITYTTTITRECISSTFTESEERVFNEWERGTVFVDTDAISQKADSIIEQWGEKYRIPNSNIYDEPADNLESGEEMILDFLNRENTQQQLEIYEFLFKRAEDGNYSIENLDTSIYNDMDLIVVTGEDDIIVDTTRSSSILVLSKDDVKSAVSACYSGDIETNLLNTLDEIYEVQETYHVNAIFTIAVAIQESSAGTNWDLIDPSTHNWMSLTGSGYVDRNGTSWKSYLDFASATRDFGDLIANRGPYFSQGNYTVATIGQKYCVPPEGWISGITSIMKRLYSAVGIDLEAVQNGTDESDRPSHGSPSPGGALGQVELDGSYNVNGVLLSNPIKDPISNIGSRPGHGAVDINPTQNGGTPVYASADGTVTTATYHSSYGNYVVIDHGSGVSTLYAHAQSLAVSAGQTVTKGQLIMYEGSTGNSTGPHVHFEIRINGTRNQSLAEDMFRQMGYTISAQ